jgi:glutamate synthase domain-containing protein 2
MHAAFVTACGELFMRGSQSACTDNCILTRVRHLKHCVKGLCDTDPLWKPARVPSELFAFLMGTHDRLGWHHAKLASDR